MTVAHRLIEADEAVERALAMALDGSPVPETAIAVWRMGLTPEATASLAISGLIGRINGRLADIRQEATAEVEEVAESGDRCGPRGRLLPVATNHAKAFWERALSRPYWTPEGPRPLLAFTLADARSLMSRAENQAAGWRKVREAMRLAERLMRSRKVDFVRDLPVDDKAAIAEAIR